MSIQAIKWCVALSQVPPSERVVLFILSDHHNGQTGRCDPSQASLAKSAGMGERTVRRHLQSLEKRGVIARNKRGGGGNGRMSDYFALNFDFVAEVEDSNRPIRAETENTEQPANSCNLEDEQPANSCRATGQSVQGYRPTLAAKPERTGKEPEEPLYSPPAEIVAPGGEVIDPPLPGLPLPACG